MKPVLSVVIVNYNTREYLKGCLRSIKAEAKGFSLEIIVVDNASSDASAEMIKNEFPEIILIENTSNTGFAYANNQGIALAKGEYVLLLNSDTVVLDGCFDFMRAFMDANPDIAMAGCKVLNADGSLQLSCGRLPSVMSEFMHFTKGLLFPFDDPFTAAKFMTGWDHNQIRDVEALSGCFMWIRKTSIENAGPLDASIFMYYEDSEFCMRIRRKEAGRIVYFPKPGIIHYVGKSSAGGSKRNDALAASFKSVLYFFNLRYGPSKTNIFRAMCRAVWMLAFPAAASGALFSKKLETKKRLLAALLKHSKKT